MLVKELSYFGNDFIKKDLKRLRGLSSLEDDVKNVCKIVSGIINESEALTCPIYTSPIGDFISQSVVDGEEVAFYKRRQGVRSHKLSPSNGVRVVFGFMKPRMCFIPILVYRASEEKTAYQINNKTYFLKAGDLKKIINEKLNSI